MFSRMLKSLQRPQRTFVVLLSVAALVAGCLSVVQLVAAGHSAPAAQAGLAVPVHAVHSQKVKVPPVTRWHRPATSWPAAGTATVTLRTTQPDSQPHSAVSAGPSAGASRRRTLAGPRGCR